MWFHLNFKVVITQWFIAVDNWFSLRGKELFLFILNSNIFYILHAHILSRLLGKYSTYHPCKYKRNGCWQFKGWITNENIELIFPKRDWFYFSLLHSSWDILFHHLGKVQYVPASLCNYDQVYFKERVVDNSTDELGMKILS